MTIMYDPPSGWKFGFPRPYLPKDGEALSETLLRDGYPHREVELGARHCRFFGTKEELDALVVN